MITSLIRSGVAQVLAHAYYGYWRAECPTCHVGQKVSGENGFTCPHDGTSIEIMWPSPDMKAGVERLLGMRPYPMTQNWYPGETLPDLMRENARHGIFDDLPAQAQLQPVFGVADDHIRLDTLPELGACEPRRELGS